MLLVNRWRADRESPRQHCERMNEAQRTAVLVDPSVRRTEFAMSASVTEAKEFSLYMIRALTNARGEAVIDLADNNF